MPRQVERSTHGDDRKNGRGKRGGKNKKELAKNEVHARKRAGEDSFHGAAFFFAGSEVNGGGNGAGHGKKNDHIAQQSDRKSTRLNSSHSQISYAVFCF